MKNRPPHMPFELGRRAFLTTTAGALLSGLLGPHAAIARATERSCTAKHVIYLFMSGGMSHIDTFDPKPGQRVQGPLKAIETNIAGMKLSEHWPRLAGHMDKVALVRSMVSNQGAHAQGQHYAHTSYAPGAGAAAPSLGAWAQHELGRSHDSLPSHVAIATGLNMATRGFFDASLAPLELSDPQGGLRNAAVAEGVSKAQFDRRLALLREMNESFRSTHPSPALRDHAETYDEALRLMHSEDLTAFDLGAESPQVRARYGATSFGQGVLLARRLVERGVRFVEVALTGWDTHANNFESLAELSPLVDLTLTALLEDLAARGLLDDTLVVLTTEFGRSPDIAEERAGGRDHHPAAFSSLLAGGGVKGGRCIGATDPEGRRAVTRPVSVPDFNASIAHAMGLRLDAAVVDPASGRPYRPANRGKVVAELF